MTKEEAIRASRRLLRAGRSGTLSTSLAIADGWAYGSLVTYAADFDASPIFLLSDLADHTRNLVSDSRASLLVEAASRRANPQTGPRVTVLGKIRKTRKPEHAERFLGRHSGARMYADFGDFNFYRMTIERVHFVGGFARAQWLRGREVAASPAAAKAVAAAVTDVVEHMNTDHAGTVELYARQLLGRKGSGWRLLSVDPDGADLASEAGLARLDFDDPAADPSAIRRELIRLADLAHSKVRD